MNDNNYVYRRRRRWSERDRDPRSSRRMLKSIKYFVDNSRTLVTHICGVYLASQRPTERPSKRATHCQMRHDITGSIYRNFCCSCKTLGASSSHLR